MRQHVRAMHQNPHAAAPRPRSNTGKLAVAEYLVGRGASVHPTSEGSQGPLHYAATCGNDRLLALLADAGASLEAPSRQGSPLCWAAAAGSGPSVRWLLARGASAAVSTSDGVTPVFMAAAAGAEECVEALLSAGSPADAPAHGGITALHVAASLCRPSLVRLLLSRGAASCAQLRDRNGQGDTPLEAAAKSRRGAAAERRETIEALLGVSPPPTGLPAQATAEDVDGWGRERGGGAAEDSGAGGDESAVASRRAVVPVAEDFDLDKAKELKRRGDEAFVSGRMEEAAQSYTESLKHDTQSAVVWANRAMACLKLGRFEDALRDAMVSRTLDADYVKAWFREGKAYHALGEWGAWHWCPAGLGAL